MPGKVLLPLNGHTVIGEVLTRCKRIPGVDEVVCTIPLGEENNKLADAVSCYCTLHRWPDENDVLGRYYNAAWTYEADIIVRVTGDCPLISPEICGAVVAEFKRWNPGIARNLGPKGFNCEVFGFKLLQQANFGAADHYDREHVTPWMYQNATRHEVHNFSLDTEDDYRIILAAFGERVQPAGSSDHPVGAVAGA